jgi:YgiT-type zinc finger domain-containing protein
MILSSLLNQGGNMQCPICEKGTLKKSEIREHHFGVSLGKFPARVCSYCGESFTDSPTTQKIEEKAKKLGVWALGATTKITKTGNSLAVRIPKKIVDHLKLKDGKEVYAHPEKGKLVIDVD